MTLKWLSAAVYAGVTYSDFLRMTPAELQTVAEADHRRNDALAWLCGRYVYEGISCALHNLLSAPGKRVKYPDQPYSFTRKEPEEVEEKQSPEEQERLRARLYMKQMEWASKGWVKKPAETQ